MRRWLLHAVVGFLGMLACAYVTVVLYIGTMSVMQWMKRGAPERASWVALSATGMLLPGIAIAWACVAYLRSRRAPIVDVQRGFEVLPPQ